MSVDGKFLLYQDLDPKTNWDLWVLPLTGDRKPLPHLHTEFAEQQEQFSPNGKWITYPSNESGTWQVYVQSFSGFRRQVSGIDCGRSAAPVAARRKGVVLHLAGQEVLCELRVPDLPGNRNYYIASADGQRFLVTSLLGDATATPFTVVLNWTSDLKR